LSTNGNPSTPRSADLCDHDPEDNPDENQVDNIRSEAPFHRLSSIGSPPESIPLIKITLQVMSTPNQAQLATPQSSDGAVHERPGHRESLFQRAVAMQNMIASYCKDIDNVAVHDGQGDYRITVYTPRLPWKAPLDQEGGSILARIVIRAPDPRKMRLVVFSEWLLATGGTQSGLREVKPQTAIDVVPEGKLTEVADMARRAVDQFMALFPDYVWDRPPDKTDPNDPLGYSGTRRNINQISPSRSGFSFYEDLGDTGVFYLRFPSWATGTGLKGQWVQVMSPDTSEEEGSRRGQWFPVDAEFAEKLERIHLNAS